MALIFMDGFDKYGVTTSSSQPINFATPFAGEWTAVGGSSTVTVAGLSGTGYALSIGNSTMSKTLAASYGRLIGGVRFSSTLSQTHGIQFSDAGTAQAGISINSTTGTFSVKNGSFSSGTVLGASIATVAASTTHYLEWDITFGNSAAYQLWLDGVSILSGTGDTTATANNTADRVAFTSSISALVVDDFYLFDNTGTVNNAALLTSPRIETQFVTGNGTVQFSPGLGVVGESYPRAASAVTPAANQLRLRSVTPAVGCSLDSISITSTVTNASVNIRPVVYADSSGVPGALLGSGATVTGVTTNATKTMPLTSSITLVAGTRYWIGHMYDITFGGGWTPLDGAATDVIATATFASGAPGTAPAMSAATNTLIWGNVTGAANWYSVSPNPPSPGRSYVLDSVVGHEDLYTYPALSAAPAAIHAVAVKAFVLKSDVAAKTASVRLKSGATDSAGTLATFSPTTTGAWYTSHHITDPDTGAAWTVAGINAAQAGLRVES